MTSRNLGNMVQVQSFYALLTEVSESEENEELLIKTLYEEKKGPCISWYDRKQLANLLQNQENGHLHKVIIKTFCLPNTYELLLLLRQVLLKNYSRQGSIRCNRSFPLSC